MNSDTPVTIILILRADFYGHLLREWGQLRNWQKEQREFYLWRQRLDERLHEWKVGKGDLLRGGALTEATDKFTNPSVDLNEAERAYIQKSLALQRRINFGIAAAVALVLVMLAVFARVQRNQAITQSNLAGTAIAAEATSDARRQESDDARATAEIAQANEETKRIEAEEAQAEAEEAQAVAEARRVEIEKKQTALNRQYKTAEAQRLATQAKLMLEFADTGDNAVLSLLLAIESLRLEHTLEGDQAIRSGLDLLPQVVLDINSEGRPHFISNSKLLAVKNEIWNLSSGNLLSHIPYQDEARNVIISPNGQWAAAVISENSNSKVIVWEVGSNEIVTELAIQADEIFDLLTVQK